MTLKKKGAPLRRHAERDPLFVITNKHTSTSEREDGPPDLLSGVYGSCSVPGSFEGVRSSFPFNFARHLSF